MDRNNFKSRRAQGARWLVALTALVSVWLWALAPTAHANVPIEGIWSFNGGEVGIQAQPDGSFAGTVVAPTKFAQCYHPIGEKVWTGIREQPDGSFAGFHQWFFATEECVPNPELGLTAWRILPKEGDHFLRVCFSEPGSKSQPEIAAGGSATGATFGCTDSSLVSSLPTAPLQGYTTLPDNHICTGGSRLRVKLHDLKGDPLKKIVVQLKSGSLRRRAKVKRSGHKVVAMLNLNGVQNSSFTVSVHITTVLGRHLSGRRTYTTCSSGKPVRIRKDKGHH